MNRPLPGFRFGELWHGRAYTSVGRMAPISPCMTTSAMTSSGVGSRLTMISRAPARLAIRVLPSSSVGEESLSPNHPDTSSRF